MKDRENFIVINGERYYTGTVFLINFLGKTQEATFVCYITKTNRVRCKLPDSYWLINADDFCRRIIEVSNKVDKSVHMPTVYKHKEMEINNLFVGWVWYIFLMMISALFYDRIGLWIFISVVFFSWRNRKIKEEGTYIEW